MSIMYFFVLYFIFFLDINIIFADLHSKNFAV